jgi:predicted Zn-dependent protease
MMEALRRARLFRPLRNGLVLLFAACATNPATGRREISLVSESQEIAMGQEADPVITAQMGGLYPDSALQQYTRAIGLSMANSSERPNLPWSFKVLDDDLINAFALPGGFIYVTRGILAHMNSEAELAGVLGHEIGHVTARHSASQMTRAQLAQLGLGVGMIFSETIRGVGEAASAGLQLLFLKFGRDDERESDELGFRYMTREQYDPNGMTAVMRMLDATSPAPADGGVPNWLSTHPDPGDRVQANEARIAAANTDFSNYTVDRAGFLQQLDDVVFGEDPRQGYFIGQRFLHPTLAFELLFPQGWPVQNSTLAVQSMSPSQDAAMSLSFAQTASAAEAARAFSTMEGMTIVGQRNESPNGIATQLLEFRAQTQQGQLSGYAAFFEYGGAVYQILGYGTAQGFNTHQNALLNGVRSFRRLTDQRYTNVAPHRVDIVTLPSAMTFSEFMQRYPSSVPAEQIARINQVAADERLPAGRLMKRVQGGRVPTQ